MASTILAAYVRGHARVADREKRRSAHAEHGGKGLPHTDAEVQAVLTVPVSTGDIAEGRGRQPGGGA
jgi:hypothetical protein